MAAGVPVVAAAAGGPGEIVRHDIDGVLYAMGDEIALADALTALARDPQRRARLADEARLMAERYLPAGIAAALSDVCRSVLRDGG